MLHKYLNIKGEEDLSVLEFAFLNSYFQTGLSGSIDEAIIARGKNNGLDKRIEERNNNIQELDKQVEEITLRRIKEIGIEAKRYMLDFMEDWCKKPNAENEDNGAADWQTNYYTEIKALPNIRLRYESIM